MEKLSYLCIITHFISCRAEFQSWITWCNRTVFVPHYYMTLVSLWIPKGQGRSNVHICSGEDEWGSVPAWIDSAEKWIHTIGGVRWQDSGHKNDRFFSEAKDLFYMRGLWSEKERILRETRKPFTTLCRPRPWYHMEWEQNGTENQPLNICYPIWQLKGSTGLLYLIKLCWGASFKGFRYEIVIL